MTNHTLQLAMRPEIGAKVKITRQRICGAIAAVHDAEKPSEWYLDILPELAVGDAELIPNVHSSGVVYVDASGERPVSP